MPRIVISFDDGRKDNCTNAVPILKKYRLSATFNITTDYINANFDNSCPCENVPMSQEDIKKMADDDLFEIAGHGKQHNNSFDNLIAGVDELYLWTGKKAFGIASPNSKMEFEDVLNNENVYKKAGINYVRLGTRNRNLKLFIRIIRKVNRLIRSDFFNKIIYRDSYVENSDRFAFPSIPVTREMTVDNIKFFINETVRCKKDLVLMFHSICNTSDTYKDNFWSWDYDKFCKLCAYLAELVENKKIFVVKMRELLNKEV